MFKHNERFRGNRNLLLFLLTLAPYFSNAQIIPPGLGETRLNSWLAFGIHQNLGRRQDGGWRSSTYIGAGRVSNRNGYNPVRDPGIFILNQEFYHHFHPHWEYSLALSYRKQELYERAPPHDRADPGYKNEFRLYGRFSYLWETAFMDITPTLRQEISEYLTPGFHPYAEDRRLRTRFRMKFSFPLNTEKTQRLLLYSEQLFSTSRQADHTKWSKFNYSDSRFSLYYSLKPSTIPVSFNVGYMLNRIGKGTGYTGHYFALDLVRRNPFSADK